MIATVFTHDGIVIATSSIDVYREMENNDGVLCEKQIYIYGHKHNKTFWSKYALVYQNANDHNYDSQLNDLFDEYESINASKSVRIQELAKDISKLIVDNNIDVQMVLAGYDYDGNKTIPYVYYLQGDNISRVNIDSNNNIVYNCLFVDKYNITGRFFKKTKILNGESWEDVDEIHTRCDLFSLEKAVDLCKFMLYMTNYMTNINTTIFNHDSKNEILIITKNKITNI